MENRRSMKRITGWAFVLVSFLCMHGILWAGEAPKKVIIRCGSALNEREFQTITAKKLAEIAAQKSKNQVEFQFFWSGVLGSERDLYEGLRIGTIDAVVGLNTVLANFAPEIGVMELPYIFDNSQQAYNLLVRGDLGDRMSEILVKKAGIRIVAWMVGGVLDELRAVSTTSRPIEKIDDFRGLKLRIPENPIHRETFMLFGANPTPIPLGEVYTSLQTNVVDGLEIPPFAVLQRKYYEVTRYMTLTNHMHTASLMAINEKVFNNLSQEQRRILQDSAKEAVAWQQNQTPPENTLDALRKQGMKIIAINIEPFKQKVAPLQEVFAKKIGALEILQEIRKEKQKSQ